MTPTRNDAAHAIACAASSLVSSPSSAHPHGPHLTSIPAGIPPRVSVQVPCGLPARLPAPMVAGAGKRRVQVQVSLWTPGGIPVLLPRSEAPDDRHPGPSARRTPPRGHRSTQLHVVMPLPPGRRRVGRGGLGSNTGEPVVMVIVEEEVSIGVNEGVGGQRV